MYFSLTALLVFVGSLILGVLIYVRNIRSQLLSIANMASMLAFVASLIYVVTVLGNGLEDPSWLAAVIGKTLLMNLYAGLFNVAARVFNGFVNIKVAEEADKRIFSRSARRISARHAFR